MFQVGSCTPARNARGTKRQQSWLSLNAVMLAAIPTSLAAMYSSTPGAAAAALQQQPSHFASGAITTVAGGTNFGDGGQANRALIDEIGGSYSLDRMVVDRSGDAYFAADSFEYFTANCACPGLSPGGDDRVRKIDAATGVITTVAGMGTAGFSGDGGPATSAQLDAPGALALDTSGDLFILDDGNQRVRKVSAATGIITTVAGGGHGYGTTFDPGYSGDGGPATKAALSLEDVGAYVGAGPFFQASGLAVDAAGDIFIGDSGNNRVRRVDARTGVITSVAGGGSPPDGIGDGRPATSAALFPNDLAVDAAGNLYVADGNTNRIRRVDAQTDVITTVAGGGSPPDGIGDGGPATSAAFAPACVNIDNGGDLVICDANRGRVRRVDAGTGIISTIAGGGSPPDGIGDGGPATSAAMGFSTFSALGAQGDAVFDASGQLYIVDLHSQRIRRVAPRTGTITTIAGAPTNGDGGPATSVQLDSPQGLAPDINGGFYVSDGSIPGGPLDNRVRHVDARGVIATFAGGGSPASGNGDGGPATQASLIPGALATDTRGNLFVTDGNRIRRVDFASGIITTFAGGSSPSSGVGDGGPATQASLAGPTGLFAVGTGNNKWPAGTLFIADGTRVRMVAPTGIITTVAGNGSSTAFGGDGGPATGAGLGAFGVVVDQAGAIYISDQANNRIRRVDPVTGIITTVAGDGALGLAGIGGPAISASLNAPTGLALSGAGDIYVYDDYLRIVKLATDGTLQVVAGDSVPGLGGDGGPAVDAELGTLSSSQFQGGDLAVDRAGNLLTTDVGDLRVRMIHLGPARSPHGCGEVISVSTTLHADIGPCPEGGVFVAANNVTLNLNGHRIFGAPTAQNGEYAGIMVSGHTGVTITGGHVDGFSAGVAVLNSTGTTVSHMDVHDNTGSFDLNAFGDGVVLFYSSSSTISGNHIHHNGPYDNLAMLGNFSNNNVFRDNTLGDSIGIEQTLGGIGENANFNAFADPNLPDRGASQVGNQFIDNVVLRGYANGISNRADIQGEIIGNTSDQNGLGDPGNGIGIGVLKLTISTPLLQELVEQNTTDDNTLVGIQATGFNFGTGSQFIDNTALGNGFDLEDGGTPPNCFNTWFGNTYNTASPCAAIGGHQVPSPPAAPSLTPLPRAQQASPLRHPVVLAGPARGRFG